MVRASIFLSVSNACIAQWCSGASFPGPRRPFNGKSESESLCKGNIFSTQGQAHEIDFLLRAICEPTRGAKRTCDMMYFNLLLSRSLWAFKVIPRVALKIRFALGACGRVEG